MSPTEAKPTWLEIIKAGSFCSLMLQVSTTFTFFIVVVVVVIVVVVVVVVGVIVIIDVVVVVVVVVVIVATSLIYSLHFRSIMDSGVNIMTRWSLMGNL